ncbi:SMI1/KNR4 family protein [Xanthomonas sp. SI]|uniref:SMI1/KNR4 family protein n=1 Tax=Xanthomonas sp. SI TaxID=2724123 RepID=UPI00163A2DE5|nr:SMI1/KNR4 family protein [Xanthomonas sp. SI]
MHEQWNRIESRLAELGCLDAIALRQGTDLAALHGLEQHLGVALPDSVKTFLLAHDGQDGPGLFFGQQLLSVAGIRAQWDTWRSIDEAEMNADCAEFMRSDPEGAIKPMYCNRAWIPLTHDWGGNHHGLDFGPDIQGHSGQIIAFGRDEDTKVRLASDFQKYVETLIEWLQSATWDGEWLENAAA